MAGDSSVDTTKLDMNPKTMKSAGPIQPLPAPLPITSSILAAFECGGCLSSSLSLQHFKEYPSKVFCDQACFEEYLINNMADLKPENLRIDPFSLLNQQDSTSQGILHGTPNSPTWILPSIPGYTLIKCLAHGLHRTSLPASIMRDALLTPNPTSPPPLSFHLIHSLFKLLSQPSQHGHPASTLPLLSLLLPHLSHLQSQQDYFEFLPSSSLPPKLLPLFLREASDTLLTQLALIKGEIPDNKAFAGVFDCSEDGLFDFGSFGELALLEIDNSRKEEYRFRVAEDEAVVYEVVVVCTENEYKRVSFWRVKKEIMRVSKDLRDFVFVDMKGFKVIDPKERISDYKNVEIRIARLAKTVPGQITDFKNIPILYHVLPGGGYLLVAVPALSALEVGASEINEKIDHFCEMADANTATSSPSKEGKNSSTESDNHENHLSWFIGNLKQKILELPPKEKDKGSQFINILDHTEFNKEQKVFWKKPGKTVTQIKPSDSLGLFADVFAKKQKPITRPSGSPLILIIEVRDPDRPTPQLWGDLRSEILFAEDEATPLYELMAVIHQNAKNKEYTCMARGKNGGLGNERGLEEVSLWTGAKGGKFYIYEKAKSGESEGAKCTTKVKAN